MWKPTLPTNGKPLYTSIAEALEQDINAGILKPGEKLPPQREIADDLNINLSTVTRAFRLCELKGLISGIVGRGTFVSSDAKVSLSMVRQDEAELPSSDLIDMGQVLPFYSLDFNTEKMAKEIIASMDMSRLLKYVDPAGLPSHRGIGAAWLKEFHLDAVPEDIIISPGSQCALSNCLLSLFSPGDRLAVDALTYPGMKSLAALHGIRLVPIEMDWDGMSARSLSSACTKETIKGTYLMPGVQNPTALSMSMDRKKELAQIIKKWGLILLEDDAYSYTGETNDSPLTALLPEQGIFLAGTSKILGPGFRISYIKAAKQFHPSIKRSILNTNWMASPITAEIVSTLVSNGSAKILMDMKRKEARKRNVLAKELLSGYKTAGVPCGFFQWVTLPASWEGQTRVFEARAREMGAVVFCAEKFAVGSGPVPSSFRLALSAPETVEELEKGLRIIKKLLDRGYEEEMIF